MHNTKSTKINRKINFILHGLATRGLSVKKKVTRNRDFSCPAETDPYMDGESIHDMTPEEELGESFGPLSLCGWQALLELILHEGSVVRPPRVNRGNDVCGKVEGGDQLLY